MELGVDIAMKMGLRAGLLLIASFFILHVCAYSGYSTAGWLYSPIPLIFMILAQKEYAKRNDGLRISFGTSYRLSFLTNVAAQAIYSIVIYVTGTWFMNESILKYYVAEVRYEIEHNPKAITDDFGKVIMEALDYITLENLVLTDFIVKSIIGIFISLILAFIFKRKATVVPENNTEND